MTFGGEACSLAAAVETVKELKERKEEIYPYIWEQGTRIRMAYNEYAKMLKINTKMIGCAPRHNIIFDEPDASGCKDLFHQEMVKRGVLMGTQIYVTPVHTLQHIEKTIKAIRASLKVVAKALSENRNNVDRYLEGHRSMAIFKRGQ